MASNAARKEARPTKPVSRPSQDKRDWDAEGPKVRELSEQEWWEMYSNAVNDELGLSVEEFEAGDARGEYDEGDAHLIGAGLRMLKTPRPD